MIESEWEPVVSPPNCLNMGLSVVLCFFQALMCCVSIGVKEPGWSQVAGYFSKIKKKIQQLGFSELKLLTPPI